LLPVFTFSTNQHKTFTPAYSPATTYDVPDQVVVANTGENGEIIIQDVYNHYQDFLQTIRSSFTFSIGFSAMKNALSLGFKYDKELMKVQHMLSNNTIAQGHSKHWWNLYQIEGLPAFLQTLDPALTAGFAQLPASVANAADAAKYDQFFNYYGTHYVSLANFGAYVHMDSFVSTDLVNKYSMQWVSTQMGLEFHLWLFNVSAGGFKNKTDIKLDNTYAQHSESYTFFEGGDPTIAGINTLSAWVATIESEPHYLNLTLRPLSELASNAGVKATMATAMNSYVANNGTVNILDFGIVIAPPAEEIKPHVLEPIHVVPAPAANEPEGKPAKAEEFESDD